MKKLAYVFTVAYLALSWAATIARADGLAYPSESKPEKHHEVFLDGGLASTIGFGGVGYAYSPLSWLKLEAGAGYGVSGLQLSLMPKLSVGNEHWRYVGGIGLSTGIPLGAHEEFTKSPALWLNADLIGGEYRFKSGWTIHAAVGGALGLAGGKHRALFGFWDNDKPEPYDEDVVGYLMPQFRVGVGYRF